MPYNEDRKGFETIDGGLIRINGDDTVRIDIYDGDEREKGGHTRDTINFDTNTGEGTIDYHNEDKSESSSVDVKCYLTTACMKHFQENFDDDCYELRVLRWFRDNFVSPEDIKHYYTIAPYIVKEINKDEKADLVYDYIYDNIVDYCVEQIVDENYDNAYKRYKNSILALEEQFVPDAVRKQPVDTIRKTCTSHV